MQRLPSSGQRVNRLTVLCFVLAAALQAAHPSSAEPASSPEVASTYGNTGLWRVLTADTLPQGYTSLSIWYDRTDRNPGSLQISTLGFGGAVGVWNRIEFGVSFQAHRDVVVQRPDQLSFGQQALGFFGNKTPGSPPAAFELMPGSSLVPQLRSPPSPNGVLTGAAGYYDLVPFAGLVRSGSAAGLLSFGLKFNLLSEARGDSFGLAVHPYFDLPIHKAIHFLLTHPVGTADLQFGFDGIVSKRIGNVAELYWNAGYRQIDQPAHISIYRLAEEVPVEFGVVAPLTSRFQFVMESTAEIFVGAHSPNTTFGPEDPVDITLGLRGRLARGLSFSAGYRRPVNQFGGDKNGFVMSLGYNYPYVSAGK